jgi:hypothetical protein
VTRPIHPDRLDRVAAGNAVPTTATPASTEEVAATLDRVLATGRLARIPRNPRHRAIVLAVLCIDLRRRHAYSEVDVNAHLVSALESLDAAVDHVTTRRYLVDLGFLKRDRAGARYFVNYPQIERTLSTAAAQAAAGLAQARRRPNAGARPT